MEALESPTLTVAEAASRNSADLFDDATAMYGKKVDNGKFGLTESGLK